MPIPGNSEPGAFSGQQQVQQKQSVTIPIKKRRFPMIEEKSSICDGQDSRNKQDCKIPDEGKLSSDARNTVSPANSDTSRISPLTVKKEVTPINIQLGQANMDTSGSMALEAKSSISLGPLHDSGNKNEKSSESVVPGSSIAAKTANAMKEIVSGQTEGTHRIELATGKMKVELSLGPKEPPVPASKHFNSEAVISNSDKLDSSLLSLALHEQKLVLHNKTTSTMGNDSSRASSNRSNWDLNTTMDVWEGSTGSDAFTHGLFDVGGLGKANSCHESSSLMAADIVGLLSNKGKRIVDSHTSSFSDVSTKHSQLCNADDSLGLRLATPYVDTSKERSSLSDNLVSSSTSPSLNVRQVQSSTMNVNRAVKSEPVEDNCKGDCSVGSSSSSSMELLKFSSVKREIHSLETVFQSSISPGKLVDSRSIKSEVVQASKSEAASVKQSVGRLMQYQESCASSSALALPLVHQNPRPSRLPTCSELTTCVDFPNQSEQSFHCKDLHQNEILDEPITSIVSKPLGQDIEQISEYKVGSLGVAHTDKHELAGVDERMHELSQEVVANDEENINISPGMLEEDAFGSDFECQQNCAADTICGKEDEEYEDGEVREPMQLATGEDSIVDGNKTDKVELVVSDSQAFQPNTSDFEGKEAVLKNQEETSSNLNKEWVGIYHEPNSEDNSMQKELSDEGLGVLDHEKRSISVTLDKQFDVSEKDVLDCPGKEIHNDVQDNLGEEVHTDALTDRSPGTDIEQGDEAIEKVVNEHCSVEDSTLSKSGASLEGPDAVKDTTNVGNKSRIINLSRAVVTSPGKTKSIPNRLLTSRSGKEGYSDLDGEMQQRGKRDESYISGSNKFVKDRAHDQSFRSSRPNFMRGRGRMSGRFGSMRREWNSDHDFSSETYGPSDYRVIRRKHAPHISDVDIECNGYGFRQDGNASAGNRRKGTNDEFPSARHTFFRRLSSGDRDGPMARGVQMQHRIPRNMSPRRCSNEVGPDVMGLRHDDKFMQLSDEVVDPDHDRPQATYDELNDQFVRGNRNFINMQRKGYPRLHSKSPVRSRTRSPGPWSSPRRRSPNGLSEFTQHRPPALFRTGRMRSPDRSCFRDEMVPRRRGSPSFVARHNNDLREGGDSRREHVHTRPTDSHRRSSLGRAFPRNTRRADALESREMEDGDEYMNGPLPSNKFHDLRGDGSIDERRKFIDRREPRPFRPNFNNDNENLRFHMNDGPRQFRFCPDAEADFAERNNMQEREFDGQIKHQPMVVSFRIRNNVEEQQDGNYRPIERVWHDDGFTDTRTKRRRCKSSFFGRRILWWQRFHGGSLIWTMSSCASYRIYLKHEKNCNPSQEPSGQNCIISLSCPPATEAKLHESIDVISSYLLINITKNDIAYLFYLLPVSKCCFWYCSLRQFVFQGATPNK